jgi:hypothetical protein
MKLIAAAEEKDKRVVILKEWRTKRKHAAHRAAKQEGLINV